MRSNGGRRWLDMLAAHDGAQRDAARIPVQVCLEHTAHVVFERGFGAEHTERQQHRPRDVAAGVESIGRTQPRALHGDAVFAGATDTSHSPPSSGGHPGEYIVFGRGQPRSNVHPIGKVGRQRRRVLRTYRKHMHEREFFEYVFVPLRVLTHFGRHPLDPPSKRPALRIDKTRREKIPVRGIGQLWRGESSANAIGQPTVELL